MFIQNLKKENVIRRVCPACIRQKLYFDRAFSPCRYEGTVKELIHQFKYRGKQHLGGTLASLMIDFIKEYDIPVGFCDAILPIPLHRDKFREREFNQAHILSERIAAVFNKEILTQTLIRNRYTKPQAELATAERLKNVANSFLVTAPQRIKDKNLVVVDDVLTTGATCSVAARALKQAGARIVFALTLAN